MVLLCVTLPLRSKTFTLICKTDILGHIIQEYGHFNCSSEAIDIKTRWKAEIFTNIASLVYNVLLILILLGRGCWGGVGWTAHLIRALTSPLSKSDEIIPNWCQYGLGFGRLQAHWQVRLREGMLMKSVLFALLKPLFSARGQIFYWKA